MIVLKLLQSFASAVFNSCFSWKSSCTFIEIYLKVAELKNITVGKHNKLDVGVHKFGTVERMDDTVVSRSIDDPENTEIR